MALAGRIADYLDEQPGQFADVSGDDVRQAAAAVQQAFASPQPAPVSPEAKQAVTTLGQLAGRLVFTPPEQGNALEAHTLAAARATLAQAQVLGRLTNDESMQREVISPALARHSGNDNRPTQ